MSVLRGEVKLRVDMEGDGRSAQAAVRGTREEIEKTNRSGGVLSDTTGAIGSRVKDLKGSVGGVNALREGFENLRSNAFFVVGAVSGVVSAVAALAESLDTNSIYLKQWESVVSTIPDTVDRAAAAGKRLREELGLIASETPIQKSTREIGDALLDIEKKSELARVALIAYNAELERLKALNAAAAGVIGTIGLIDDAEKSRNLTLTLALDLTEALTKATLDYALGMKRAQDAANDFTGPPLPEGWDPTADINFDPMVITPRKRGGGGAPRDDTDARWAAMIKEQSDKAARTRIIGKTTAGGFTMAGRSSQGEAETLDKTVLVANKLAESFDSVARSVMTASEAMPEFGAALAEIRDITQQVADKNMSLKDALLAGGVAIAANSVRRIGGLRAEAGVRAAYEYYMGFATLDEPPISVGHFIAAAGLTAVAAGAGGGGGGRGTSGGGAASRGQARYTRVSSATRIGDGGVHFEINAPWFGGLQEGSAYLYGVLARGTGNGMGWAA